MSHKSNRAIAILSVFLIFFSLPASYSNSIARLGGKCSKLDQRVIIKEKTLVCKKQSNLLVWRQYKPIVRNRILLSDVIWATSKTSNYPIQDFSFPIPKKRVSSWSDLLINSEGIPYQAWKYTSMSHKNSKSKVGKIISFVGPNTIPTYPDLRSAMDSISRAFPTASEVNQTKIFLYNYSDLEWAKQTYQKEIENETGNFKLFNSKSIEENCDKLRQVCWAMGFTDSNLEGIILLGILEEGSQIKQNQTFDEYARSNLGFTLAHEYFHTIQRKLLGDSWFEMSYTPPSWFIEGSATFAETAAMNPNSWDGYMHYRTVYSKFVLSNCKYHSEWCVEVNEDKLNDFMQLKHYESNWNNFPVPYKYEVSARIIEVLVALKGPESIVELMQKMGQRLTFDQAFELVYGLSYSEAIPIISKIVAQDLSK